MYYKNIVVCVVLTVALCLVQSIVASHQHDNAPEYFWTCAEEFHIDEETIFDLGLLDANITLPDKPSNDFKCFIKCCFIGQKLMFPDGGWALDEAYRHLKPSDQVLLDECARAACVFKDKCEETFELLKCSIEKLSVFKH